MLISLQMDIIINPIPHRTSFNLKKANWDRYRKEIEDKLSKRGLPINCKKKKILLTIILKVVTQLIPSGRHRINTEAFPPPPVRPLVSREIKRKSLMSAVTFTTDQVIRGISNCSNTKAFGPDKLSIFHLKNLGPKAI